MKSWQALCCLIVLHGTLLAEEPHQDLSGRVFDVLSGDQLVIAGPENTMYRLRMLGIRAPAGNGWQAKDSRRHLRTLLLGRFVTVDYRGRSNGTAILGKVTYGGADMNLRQIQAGLARFRPHSDQSEYDRQLYRLAETEARATNLGMWRAAVNRARK